LYNYHSRY